MQYLSCVNCRKRLIRNFFLQLTHDKYCISGTSSWNRTGHYFCLHNLEKAFGRVPRVVLWWAMRKVSVEEVACEGSTAHVQTNVTSRVRVGDSYSGPFSVKVGIYQGSVPSPLHAHHHGLEVVSQEFLSRCP